MFTVVGLKLWGKTMIILYRILFLVLVLPIALIRLFWLSLKTPAYRHRMPERLGRIDVKHEESIWVHAVSVGEFMAAIPIIKRLLEQRPKTPIVITTMTPTGSERVQSVFKNEMGHRIFHSYCPYDTPWCIRPFLRAIQPKLLIVMETELWPELIRQAKQADSQILIANARLSAKSAKGYRRFYGFVQSMLRDDIDVIAAQSVADKKRFEVLGVPSDRCKVTGTIKYDIQVDLNIKQQAHEFKAALGSRFIWVAASTHEGEDEEVLEAHQKLIANEKMNNALLILVPRHPERFDEVARMVEEKGLPFIRRSSNDVVKKETQVYLGDTMGELMMLYALADAAFVGGSLVKRGGHNVLEPIALNVPCVVGPHTFNFSDVIKSLVKVNAIGVVTRETLSSEIEQLGLNKDFKNQRITAAKQVMDAKKGALDHLMSLILSRL